MPSRSRLLSRTGWPHRALIGNLLNFKAACLCANAPLRLHILRRPRRVCWRTVLRANMQLAFTVALLVALLACAGE